MGARRHARFAGAAITTISKVASAKRALRGRRVMWRDCNLWMHAQVALQERRARLGRVRAIRADPVGIKIRKEHPCARHARAERLAPSVVRMTRLYASLARKECTAKFRDEAIVANAALGLTKTAGQASIASNARVARLAGPTVRLLEPVARHVHLVPQARRALLDAHLRDT